MFDLNDAVLIRRTANGESRYVQNGPAGNDLNPASATITDRNGELTVETLQQPSGPAPQRIIVNYHRVVRETNVSMAEWKNRLAYTLLS